VKTRGIAILLRDLPQLGKEYDRFLSNDNRDQGEEIFLDIPISLKLSKSKVRSDRRDFPFLFGDLFRLVSVSRFERSDASDVDIVLCSRTILNLFKKVEYVPTAQEEIAAVAEYFATDSEISPPHDYWESTYDEGRLDSWRSHLRSHDSSFHHIIGISIDNDSRYEEHRETLLHIASDMDSLVQRILPCETIRWEDYSPKHGPGSVSDWNEKRDKYSFPNWPERLSEVFPSYGWATHMLDNPADAKPDFWGSDVSSQVICVPKTYGKPRVIASEPTAHMYCQQAILPYIRKNLPSGVTKCISVHDQEPSRQKSLEGSRLGNLCTIDLSKASDRVTTQSVVALLRNQGDLLEAIRASRTAAHRCDKYKFPLVRINKFAPMGSAVTFPVQTILYFVASLATLRMMTGNTSYAETDLKIGDGVLQVFGDDIIVPSTCYHMLVLVLEALGLKVNYSKSHFHVSNCFRESCGMDAYKGYDVTPLYLTRLDEPTRPCSALVYTEVANNAYSKGLWMISQTIRDSIAPKLGSLIPVCNYALPCARFLSFWQSPQFAGKRRWDQDLQTWKRQGIVAYTTGGLEKRDSWEDLLQYFVEGFKPGTLSHLDPAFSRVGVLSDFRTKFSVRWVNTPE
jgi:hypothetical protein